MFFELCDAVALRVFNVFVVGVSGGVVVVGVDVGVAFVAATAATGVCCECVRLSPSLSLSASDEDGCVATPLSFIVWKTFPPPEFLFLYSIK